MISHCPVCQSNQLNSFLTLRNLPVYCNLLWSEQAAAKACTKGDINLAVCLACGFILNASFNPKLLAYSQDYENSLHYSGRFQEYADNLAHRLVETHQLYGKKIIEIGCGKGDFLESLCRIGNNSGIGFDNSYVPIDRHADLEITFIQDFYSEKYTDYTGDFVCCRQVLEHLQEPLEFLERVKKLTRDRSDAVLFFEVPNSAYIFQKLSIWDIIYEHCNYFTDISLAYGLQKAGFRIKDLTEEFGGQFLGIEGVPSQKPTAEPCQNQESLEVLFALLEVFKDKFDQKIAFHKHQLAELNAADKRVAIWGTGSKGVTFLNLLDGEQTVAYAIDVNPKKQGKFVAGTGQKILSPDQLQDVPVDVVMIMNPLYQEEIRASLANLHLSPELLIL